jgi:hypothetical protein
VLALTAAISLQCPSFGHFKIWNPVMKTIVTDFLRDQSGAAEFDGMTVFNLVVAGPIALYFLLHTFGGVYDAVFGLVASAVHR